MQTQIRSLKAFVPTLQKKRGHCNIAINEWLTYFNVKMNQIQVLAGREVTVKITPEKHVATHKFKLLPLKHRKCRFDDENPVHWTQMIVKSNLH